jgi:protein-S-isoprenylcysteine O-methyltransferase Ste14
VKAFERVFVWAGGTVFALSIAFAAYSYFVRFRISTAWRGWDAVAIDGAMFAGFALHHSLFARDWVTRRLAPIPARLRRSVYVWIASLLLILVCAAWQTVGGTPYDVHGAAAWMLAGIQGIGVWLIARAVGKIDPLELAGIRAGDTAADREPLQITGPYRIVRHPLYLGWMLVTFGAAHMTGNRLAFAIITAIYLVVAVPWEERALMQSFGDEYRRYRALVRWRIVPYVY